MIKVAISGVTGFIGSEVLSLLQNKPVEISVLVRPGSKFKINNKNIKIIYIDIYEPPENLYQLLDEPDIYIHLVWNYLDNYFALQHFEKELPAHYLFLSTLVKSGLKNLLVTGTCLEYGLQNGEMKPNMIMKPVTPYGFAKDTLRKQLEYLQQSYPFNLTWSRLFYIYGDSETKNSLYFQLREAVARGDKVFKMSKGEQLRDYLPVQEVAKKIIEQAMRQENSGVINICSGVPISIRSIVESWIELHSWAIELRLGEYPYPKYEPLAFWGKVNE